MKEENARPKEQLKRSVPSLRCRSGLAVCLDARMVGGDPEFPFVATSPGGWLYAHHFLIPCLPPLIIRSKPRLRKLSISSNTPLVRPKIARN